MYQGVFTVTPTCQNDIDLELPAELECPGTEDLSSGRRRQVCPVGDWNTSILPLSHKLSETSTHKDWTSRTGAPYG